MQTSRTRIIGAKQVQFLTQRNRRGDEQNDQQMLEDMKSIRSRINTLKSKTSNYNTDRIERTSDQSGNYSGIRHLSNIKSKKAKDNV